MAAATTYEAGQDCDSYCTKCQLVLAHVIIAMRGTHPAMVECKTCHAVHAYKKEAPSAKKTGTKRSPSKAKATARQTTYQNLLAGRDISGAEYYKTTTLFAEADVVDHKIFGLGVVTQILSDNTIEVMFQASTKTLVHGR